MGAQRKTRWEILLWLFGNSDAVYLGPNTHFPRIVAAKNGGFRALSRELNGPLARGRSGVNAARRDFGACCLGPVCGHFFAAGFNSRFFHIRSVTTLHSHHKGKSGGARLTGPAAA